MFSDLASELITIAVQAFFITVAGWIFVFAWQDIGGVENFKAVVFRRRNMRNLQKSRRKSKQNQAAPRAYAFKQGQDSQYSEGSWL